MFFVLFVVQHMATFEDILDRLATHAEAARGAGVVTKSDAFYLGRLGELDEDLRARVMAWCQNNGMAATFGTTPLGGASLTLRANAGE